uniref:Peptidase M24 domain-containing protein n=1 Tax=Brassica campestris TaxID=3711 RepID=M4D285_BRACM
MCLAMKLRQWASPIGYHIFLYGALSPSVDRVPPCRSTIPVIVTLVVTDCRRHPSSRHPIRTILEEPGRYTSATFFCGDVDEKAKKLVQVTKESLDKAISICGAGVKYKKIGKTIHDHADKHKYGVVRQFVGHGIGRVFHSDPVVLHFRNNEAGRMVLNQTFTIEPMLTVGSIKPVMWDDDWTVITEDASLSAQFEHTILITKHGAEILTNC